MDPIQQLIAQLTQQYAGGVGAPLSRAVDPMNGNALNYADVNLGGQQKRLMYQPGMESGLPEGGRAAGRYFTDLSGPMANPTTGKQGAVRGFFGEDGSFQGAEWWNDEQSWVDKVLSAAPALVLGAAALGAGGFLPGMTGGEAAAAAGGSTTAGAAGGLAPGSATGFGQIGTGLGELGSGTFGNALGAAELPFGTLTGGIGTTGQTALTAGMVADPALMATLSAGGGAAGAALAPQAASAPQAGSMGGAAAPGAGATPAAGGAGILDTMKSLATYAGPAASLLGAAQTVSAVNDLQASMPAMRPPEVPPVPAAQANPAARGYQAASNPILSVLGRNREANRNRTMLTGPRGVNMDSVRVGGNSLLGM